MWRCTGRRRALCNVSNIVRPQEICSKRRCSSQPSQLCLPQPDPPKRLSFFTKGLVWVRDRYRFTTLSPRKPELDWHRLLRTTGAMHQLAEQLHAVAKEHGATMQRITAYEAWKNFSKMMFTIVSTAVCSLYGLVTLWIQWGRQDMDKRLELLSIDIELRQHKDCHCQWFGSKAVRLGLEKRLRQRMQAAPPQLQAELEGVLADTDCSENRYDKATTLWNTYREHTLRRSSTWRDCLTYMKNLVYRK